MGGDASPDARKSALLYSLKIVSSPVILSRFIFTLVDENKFVIL